MHEFGGLSAPLALLALFLFCLYLGLYHGLFGLLLSLVVGPGRDNRRALVAAPFLWVAVELARDARHRLSVEPAGHGAGG